MVDDCSGLVSGSLESGILHIGIISYQLAEIICPVRDWSP